MRRTRYFLLALSVWVCAKPARAEEPLVQAGSSVLSLADCLSRAQRLSPRAVSALLQEAQARAAKQEAQAGLLPQISAVGLYQQSNNPDVQTIDSNEAALRLTQDLSPFSPRWALARQKEAEFRAVKARRLATDQDVALEVKTLYLSILRETDELKGFKKLKEKLDVLHSNIIPKYSVGRTPFFDLVKIKMILSGLAKSRDLTRAQRAQDKESLALIVGLESGEVLALQSLRGIPSFPANISFPENKNPRLKVLKEQIAAAQAAAQAAKDERYPTLNAGLDYGYMGNSGLFNLYPSANYPVNPFSSPVGWGYNASLSLSLPLWNWGRIADRIFQNEQVAALAKKQKELERQTLESHLAGLQLKARSFLADKQRMFDLLPETQRAAEAQTRLYRRGATGILEAADALNIWLNTMISERDDYYSYLQDLARMENIMGKNLVRYE